MCPRRKTDASRDALDDPAQVGHLDLAFHGDQGEKGRPEGNEMCVRIPACLPFVLSLEADEWRPG